MEILPTADKTQKIQNTKTVQQLEKLVPDKTVMIDGTHTPVQRPQKNNTRKESYSGKKKQFTTLMTNRDGLVIYAGPPHRGSTHDITALRNDNPDLGMLTDSMKNPNTRKKITVYADLGYQGILKTYPGINLKIPEKKPPNGKLTQKF